VAIIQRFGSALNLNVHVHALVLDGVYVEDGRGTVRFHAAAPRPDEEMDRLIAAIERRIQRLLARRVFTDPEVGDAADAWREQEPVLAGIAAASAQGRRALGERAGAQVVRCGTMPEGSAPARSGLGSCHARWRGFDLHATAGIQSTNRSVMPPIVRPPRLTPASIAGFSTTRRT